MRRQLIISAAESISAGHASAVQAEFAKAGISAEVTQQLLKRYEPYLNWDIETKLRPALQSWLQELGAEQLSQQLHRSRTLLLRKPDECSRVYLWLSSKGIDPDRVQRKAPQVMLRELLLVQQAFEALQQAAALSDAQMCTLLYKHSAALAYGPEHVFGTLQAVSTVLGMPMKSDSFKEAITCAHERLFLQRPATLHQRVTFFCQMYATGTHVTRTALTMGVFTIPEPVMKRRAAKLQEQLGWDSKQLKEKLSSQPGVLTKEPSTIARNIQEMQNAGFSLNQVWEICTMQPALLGTKWTSDTSVEKLQFSTCLLGLTLNDIAARPHLLTASVNSSLGPRVWFLYQTGAIEAPNTVMTSGLSAYLKVSKVRFSKRFSAPSAFPSMVFDSAFTDHWKQRWDYLRQHMKLSVETIAAHQDLLLASLPDRLSPRWQLLSRLASEQAGFKAEDHLTALATLSDQDFTQAFHANGKVCEAEWLMFVVVCTPTKGCLCTLAVGMAVSFLSATIEQCTYSALGQWRSSHCSASIQPGLHFQSDLGAIACCTVWPRPAVASSDLLEFCMDYSDAGMHKGELLSVVNRMRWCSLAECVAVQTSQLLAVELQAGLHEIWTSNMLASGESMDAEAPRLSRCTPKDS